MKEVNLFESYLKSPNKGARLGQSLKIGAVVFLAAYCVVAAGVFSFWLFLKQKDNSLTRKIDDQKRQISQLEPVESLHVLIKERLKVLSSEELTGRTDFSVVLADIEKTIVPGISVNSFSAAADSGLSLGGEAKDAVILAEFFGKLIDMGKGKKEGTIEISSASRSKGGSYTFEIISNAE